MKSDKPNHQLQQRQERQQKGWQFTFFGETPPGKLEEKQQEKIDQKPTVGSCFPLGMATVGECLWIVDMESKEVTNRLLAMGLIPGTELKVVSCTPGGSVIVAVQDNRIGLNASMAQNILVSSEPICRHKERERRSQN
ncbi:MAG: FeoA family protein [Coleofasciculaceae cyanobacterium]